MIDFKVGIVGLENLERRLTGLRPQLLPRIKRTVIFVFGQAVRYVTQNHLTGGTSSTRLATRTANLKRSIGFKVESGQETVYGEWGSFDMPYNRIHETGRTLIAKKSAKLWIPLQPNKTAAGVARFSPRAIFDTLVIRRSLAGNLIAWQKQGKKLIPMFLLKDSVRIPARPYIGPTFSRSIAPMLNAELDRMVEGTVRAL